MDYSKHFSTRKTPQSQPIPGSTQVRNRAGGYAWALDDWGRLDRFLILGTEGGTYYASERQLTSECGEVVHRLAKVDGPAVVRRIVEVSEAGRAPKNDPALFALALCAGAQDVGTRRAALQALPRVARIGTHLMHFVQYVNAFRGRGRAYKRALTNWYADKSLEDCAYQMVKYRQRDGWSHRDILRLVKPVPDSPERSALYAWAVGKEADTSLLPAVVKCHAQMAAAESTTDVLSALDGCPRFPWEGIPTEHLGKPEVWRKLLPNLPMTALLRNLARMTASGALKPLSDEVDVVAKRLRDESALRKARVHPIAVLSALRVYASGNGARGSLQWQPIAPITDALNDAFYLSFGNVAPTGKRLLVALDVSGSMTAGQIAGVPGLTPRDGAAAMAMVVARTEPNYHMMAFCERLVDFGVSAGERLDDVIHRMDKMPFGGTDCALPMIYATQERLQVDAFVVYTDSETWAGNVHPFQALMGYRQILGIPAKLIVVGMTADQFSIADPDDGGMLDVVGFDTATPQLMSDFIGQ